MRSTTIGSTLLLLAGGAIAQSESVVTEIPSSLIQSTEEVFTIQTSIPTGVSSVCYEVCVQSPCYACSATDPVMSLPVESLPGVSSIPPVSLPVPIETSVPTPHVPIPITSSVPPASLPVPISDVSGSMSIPQGETPQSTGAPSTTSGSGSASASASGSAPAQQTTAAAPPSLKGDSTPLLFALGISGVSVLLGAAWTLL